MSLFPSATTIKNAEEDSEVIETGENQLKWLSNASYQTNTSYGASRSKLLKGVEQFAEDDLSELGDLKDYKAKKDSWDRESGRSERHKRKHNRKHHKRKRDEKNDIPYDSNHEERSRSHSKLQVSHRDKSKRRSRSRSKSRERNRSRKRGNSRSRSRSGSREKLHRSRPSSIWLDDQGNVSDALFYIDPKPDRNNLCFDTLDYKDSAFYKTLGRTCLGGTHLNEAIFWSGNKKGKSRVKKVRKDRYFSRFVSAVPSDETVSLSDVIENKESVEKTSGFKDKMEVEIEAADPFIPVENKTKSKSLHSSEIDPLGLYDQSTRQYLGIPNNTLDDGQTASSDAGMQVRNPITDQVAYFNRHLSENPKDTSKWMEFIHFQEELVKSTVFNISSGHHGNLKTREQLLAQRKLVILEKALERNPGCLELQLEQVEVCRDVWESSKVSDLWSKMLKNHRGNKDLWHHYLLFCKSFYSSFSVSNISTIYAECIQSLLECIDDDQEDSAVTETDVFDIFIQLCHFWHQAGHTEKAIAAFQAMIELNFFCPEHLEQSTTLSAQLAFLETFWDSDEPKFGENGAKGWSHWMLLKEKGGWQQTAESSSTDDEDNDLTLDPSLSKVEAWLKEELTRGYCHLLPWRPSKDETADDCEDPDRLVLFDDISKVIFKLTGTISKFQLILGLLELIGIQNEAPLTSNSSHTDNFLNTVLQSLQQLLHCKFALSTKSRDNSQESFISSWHSVWQRNCPGVLRICEGMGGDVTAGMKGESSWTNAEPKSLSKFVDNVIDQLMPKVSLDQQSVLRLLQLRFHLTNVILSKEPKIRKKQLKTVQKNAKRTLSLEGNRNNLAMWEAYALWEWGVGNRNEGHRILETALSFAGVPKTDSENHDYTRLTHTAATLKLYQLFIKSESGIRYHSSSDQGENSDTLEREAINMLTTLGEGVRFVPLSQFHDGTVTSGRILKARKRFVELLEECKMEYSPIVGPSPAPPGEDSVVPSGSHLYHLTSCYAVFQYLTVSLQASRVVFQEVLSFLDKVPVVVNNSKTSLLSPQKEIDYELLTMAEIQLVSFHSGVLPVPLTQLRSLLQKALTKYPTNSVLLEVFLQTERKSQVMGRLRRHFHRVIGHTQSPVPILFAIFGELRRHAAIQAASIDGQEVVAETGITHQIRSLFERSVRSQYTRHCILFWRMYIHFEVCQGNMKKAKSIFYRALQHCPWSKALYLDIVRYFPDEVEEIIDLMMEKELRVRVPLEEIELLMNASKRE